MTEENHFSLMCCETELSGKTQRAMPDPVLLDDSRVLANLLATEDKYLPHTCYFNCVQSDIQPYMRKMVTEWMAEVCSEHNMEEEVFCLSVNYLDRFLCIRDVKRTRLQLLGASCMFLASKLKETCPISGEQLVMYTDNSITLQELTDMESLVLQVLKWDLSAIVPNDFLDHILHRIPLSLRQTATIKKQAQGIAVLCATDCAFMQIPPSIIACSAVASTLRSWKQQEQYEEDLSRLHLITGTDTDLIRACVEQVDQAVRNCVAAYTKHEHRHSATKYESLKQEQPTTPTDVRDINILASQDDHQLSHPFSCS